MASNSRRELTQSWLHSGVNDTAVQCAYHSGVNDTDVQPTLSNNFANDPKTFFYAEI
jgi:hypothetical protein